MSHTPGPWSVSESIRKRVIGEREQEIVTADGQMVALLYDENWDPRGETDAANARLIAAAPDLLAACEEFVRKVDCGEAFSTRSYQQMKAAIAKAKGNAP